jgi:hypothetical protein
MDAKDAARWLSGELGIALSPTRVYELARREVLPHVRLGRRVIFHEDVLKSFLETGGAGFPRGGWRFQREAQGMPDEQVR